MGGAGTSGHQHRGQEDTIKEREQITRKNKTGQGRHDFTASIR